MYYSTKPSVMHYLVALALTVGRYQLVLAANDWQIPCVQGQCSWDLPSDSGASGTLQIVCFLSHIPLRAFKHTLTITPVGLQYIDLRSHLRGRMEYHAL